MEQDGWSYTCVMDRGELNCYNTPAWLPSGGGGTNVDSIAVLPVGVQLPVGGGQIPIGDGRIGNMNTIGLNSNGIVQIPNPFSFDPLQGLRDPLRGLILIGLLVGAVIIVSK